MRNSRFTFACTVNERQQLKYLAKRLSRNESDAVRWLISEAVKKYKQDDLNKPIIRLKKQTKHVLADEAHR